MDASQRLSFGVAGKAHSQTVAKVANRTREIRPSGMKTEARGNMTHGGTRNPTRNRKSGSGHSPPTGACTLVLSRQTRPAKGSPPEPVASLATVAATRPAKRRHASVWAVGFAASKTMSSRMPRVLFHLKATTTSPSRWARRGSYPAGCSTTARRKRTAQEPGRPSLLLERYR